jgi:hypothetical protein
MALPPVTGKEMHQMDLAKCMRIYEDCWYSILVWLGKYGTYVIGYCAAGVWIKDSTLTHGTESRFCALIAGFLFGINSISLCHEIFSRKKAEPVRSQASAKIFFDSGVDTDTPA